MHLKSAPFSVSFYALILDFWLRVKDKLDFQDSTQRDLAQNINESYNTLQSWINRDRLPNAEQAVKIADALNTSVEFLVTGKSNNRKNDHSTTVKLLEQAIENLQKEIQ